MPWTHRRTRNMEISELAGGPSTRLRATSTYRHLAARGVRIRADGKEVADDTWHLHGSVEDHHPGGQHRHSH